MVCGAHFEGLSYLYQHLCILITGLC